MSTQGTANALSAQVTQVASPSPANDSANYSAHTLPVEFLEFLTTLPPLAAKVMKTRALERMEAKYTKAQQVVKVKTKRNSLPKDDITKLLAAGYKASQIAQRVAACNKMCRVKAASVQRAEMALALKNAELHKTTKLVKETTKTQQEHAVILGELGKNKDPVSLVMHACDLYTAKKTSFNATKALETAKALVLLNKTHTTPMGKRILAFKLGEKWGQPVQVAPSKATTKKATNTTNPGKATAPNNTKETTEDSEDSDSSSSSESSDSEEEESEEEEETTKEVTTESQEGQVVQAVQPKEPTKEATTTNSTNAGKAAAPAPIQVPTKETNKEATKKPTTVTTVTKEPTKEVTTVTTEGQVVQAVQPKEPTKEATTATTATNAGKAAAPAPVQVPTKPTKPTKRKAESSDKTDGGVRKSSRVHNPVDRYSPSPDSKGVQDTKN